MADRGQESNECERLGLAVLRAALELSVRLWGMAYTRALFEETAQRAIQRLRQQTTITPQAAGTQGPPRPPPGGSNGHYHYKGHKGGRPGRFGPRSKPY